MTQSLASLALKLKSLKVLIVDDEREMRLVLRGLLINIGITSVIEARDAPNGLEKLCAVVPDIVVLALEMPGMSGFDFVRTVRSPNSFPVPDVPIIMLTAHGERWRVEQGVRLGINEFLLKPVSSKAVLARITAIVMMPRRCVQKGKYYGPEPRKLSTYKPEFDPDFSDVFLLK